MPKRVPALFAIALLAASARAGGQWVQIGDGIHATGADEKSGTHHESGRIAQVSLGSCSAGSWG